jgi:hypothetical protein
MSGDQAVVEARDRVAIVQSYVGRRRLPAPLAADVVRALRPVRVQIPAQASGQSQLRADGVDTRLLYSALVIAVAYFLSVRA